MKAILLMFDTLNRRMLSPYGCDWTHTPNFKRLAEKTVTFDNSYVGSLPCMPARRELHTGRYNFLHRPWGPLEPFDDSMIKILRDNGVYTHLASDHYHYWEDGGSTYHTRYDSWDFFRGQEGDPWIGTVKKPEIDPVTNINFRDNKAIKNTTWVWQNLKNREFIDSEEKFSQTQTIQNGLDFLDRNHDSDNWFLQIETFDPHEPYFAPQKYKDLYDHGYTGPLFDWPEYGPTTIETPELKEHIRYEYAALLSMCDASLGKILDKMDALNLWEDTMLIVCTDHGFLLGEHEWFGKSIPPFYNEICHTPLFIWHPQCKKAGERRSSLVQWIDFAPTLLDYFGMDIPSDMQGHSLRETIMSDKKIRDSALYGANAGHVGCTDGRYTYLRAPAREDNQPLFTYTLMPMHMFSLFTVKEMQSAEYVEPFSFTKGCKVLKIPSVGRPHQPLNHYKFGNMLFDLQADPYQNQQLNDPEVERMMINHMVRLMAENDAPMDQYERLGLTAEYSAIKDKA